METPELDPPADWLLRHRDALGRAARLGPVVDVACGGGRHALAVAQWGLFSLAIDRSGDSLDRLGRAARRDALPVRRVRADLERDDALPLRDASCGALLVFRYLHRPLAPALVRALAPGGLLLYETFTEDQRALGWGPRRAAFLLRRGELPRLFAALEPIASEEGPSGDARPAHTARLSARRVG